MGDEVRSIVDVESIIMVGVLVAINLITIACAVVVSNGIVKPINELVHVVHALYTMDYSNQVCLN